MCMCVYVCVCEHLPQHEDVRVLRVNGDAVARVPPQHVDVDVGRAADHQLELGVREERQQPHRQHRSNTAQHRMHLRPPRPHTARTSVGVGGSRR